MKAKSILLIEDDTSIAQPLIKLLTLKKFEVRWTACAREALKVLGNDPLPDCILVDIMMPTMNGWEFRDQQLQSNNEALRKIPTIFLSADSDAAEEAVERRGRFVSKPIDFENLTHILEESMAGAP